MITLIRDDETVVAIDDEGREISNLSGKFKEKGKELLALSQKENVRYMRVYGSVPRNRYVDKREFFKEN